MSWHYPISITHAPSGHPGGIVDRLRLMQESSLTLCPFFEGAFCPLSREAIRGEGALRILWRRGLGIRRRCGSRGRTDSKMRRVWFVNGTASRTNPNNTHAVPEPSMGEGTAEVEAPAFMPGRTSQGFCAIYARRSV